MFKSRLKRRLGNLQQVTEKNGLMASNTSYVQIPKGMAKTALFEVRERRKKTASARYIPENLGYILDFISRNIMQQESITKEEPIKSIMSVCILGLCF